MSERNESGGTNTGTIQRNVAPKPGEVQWQGWLTWTLVGVALGVVLGGITFYFVLERPGSLSEWGARGDALAPFVGLITACALGAAIWSVHLQLKELRETREEFKHQAEHLGAAAEAQKALSEATQRLAKAQEHGNELLKVVGERETLHVRAVLTASYNSLKAAKATFAVSRLQARVMGSPDLMRQYGAYDEAEGALGIQNILSELDGDIQKTDEHITHIDQWRVGGTATPFEDR